MYSKPLDGATDDVPNAPVDSGLATKELDAWKLSDEDAILNEFVKEEIIEAEANPWLAEKFGAADELAPEPARDVVKDSMTKVD